MEIYAEMRQTFYKLEEMIETRHMEDFIARGYESAPYFYNSFGAMLDIRILNENERLYRLLRKAGIRYKKDMAVLLLQLFYLYLQEKGESQL